MAAAEQYPVHLGVWTNWSRGPVLGATLTLDRTNANLLVAFVAFFVAWVGTRLWRITCLILHFSYSSQHQQDTLYHQRQAILRNSANPESGLMALTYLLWAWKQQPTRPFARLLIVLATAAVFVAGFAVASGFSSKVSLFSSGIGNEVLISGQNCAILNATKFSRSRATDPLGTSKVYDPHVAKQLSNWVNYAQQCYGGIETDSPRVYGCGTFVQPQLLPRIQKNASCPFDATMCKSQDRNLLIDTGYLDSHDVFGINAPPQERFQYRRVVHCAPLSTEGYTSQYNLSSDRSFTRYHYGTTGSTARNFTYEHSNDRVFELMYRHSQGAAPDYSVGTKFVYYTQGSPDAFNFNMKPIPQLATVDGDLSLHFLSANDVGFMAPAYDPWYQATKPMLQRDYIVGNKTVRSPDIYFQDQAASPLGCKIQHQLCNPNQPEATRCGPLTSFIDFGTVGVEFAFSNATEAGQRIDWAWMAAFGSHGIMVDIVAQLGASSLLSRLGLGPNSLQGPIPDNQWMLDVQYWHNIAMTSIQGALLAAAAGPANGPIADFYNVRPSTTPEFSLCNNQKIVNTSYVSFSLFGVLLIFILGGVIMLVSIILDPLMSFLRKRFAVKPYQQLEWRTNDALQLQRLAHEELGFGTWSDAAEIVPVTLAADKLASLDISTPDHPRLQVASSPSSRPGREMKNHATVREGEVPNADPASTPSDRQSSVTTVAPISPSGTLRPTTSVAGTILTADAHPEPASPIDIQLNAQRHSAVLNGGHDIGEQTSADREINQSREPSVTREAEADTRI